MQSWMKAPHRLIYLALVVNPRQNLDQLQEVTDIATTWYLKRMLQVLMGAGMVNYNDEERTYSAVGQVR
jgi:hypothetical protein